MEKSRDAFRTISEVAEWLDVPTHVLRFWESRFSQIKPVKRAGGRRYYRPSDMRVIGGVKVLLHDQGMTIRGVQKLFREQGIKHVSSFSPKLFGEEDDVIDATAVDQSALEAAPEDMAPQAPASAARTTRDAAPDPIVDAAPDIEDAELVEEPDAPVDLPEEAMESDDLSADQSEAPIPTFSHARTPAAPAPEVEDTDRVGADDVPVEASAPPAPVIPHVDVPDTDATDDAEAHRKGPGIAARLRVQKRAALAAHRDDLAEAARRLRDLHGRMS